MELCKLVELINKKHGLPNLEFQKTKNGLKPIVGNFHLRYSKRGVSLCQIMDERGATSHVFRQGYTSENNLKRLIKSKYRNILKI